MSGRPRYGRDAGSGSGGRVAAVDEGGPAARAGIAEGDVILAADGAALADELDWRWHADGPAVEVALADGRTARLERAPGEAWGVAFADPLFDGVRTCDNRCSFCFMAQLPKGLRKALYLRDDDFRLSFLQGNFVTLTNLTDADERRIIEQALSPLYVSVHSTDPAVRARLVCARDDRALERFDRLVEGGIDLHVQIVLVPGENDGADLERTLTWLAEREGVPSVGIVPVGRTRHQEALTRSFESAEEASAVIEQVRPWQEAYRARYGLTWVQLADEFYLVAGEPLPPASEYDGFPQFENGIGMARSFVDGATGVTGGGADVTLVTGTLFAPVLRGTAPDARVLAVPNRLFGGNVSVAGLLSGADIAEAIAADGAVGTYVLPDSVLNADGVLLDDLTPGQVAERAGAPVRVVSSDPAGLAAALSPAPIPPV